MTARELYALVVGECGVEADYFLRRMSQAEVRDYLTGYYRRERGSWERARLLADTLCRVMTGKGVRLRFPWDGENERPAQVSADELARLRAEARRMEKRLNHGKE